MLKVVTAIGNEYINEELKLLNKYNVLHGDIVYQEALMEFIEKEELDVLVIYENILGDRDAKTFLEELMLVEKQFEILVIVDKINDKIVKLYKSKGIVNLIPVNNLTIDLICNKIDHIKQETNVKHVIERPASSKLPEFDIKNNKVIVVFGTNGSGKTSFATNLAIALGDVFSKKILIVDFDISNASVDVLCNLKSDKFENSLLQSIELIKKNLFLSKAISEIVFKYNKYINVFSGNTDLFVCQNVLCEKYYEDIYNKIIDLYDCIIIDLNSNMFLDVTKWALKKATSIYCVIEGNYNSLKNMKNSLLVIDKTWDINLSKIQLIINKTNIHSIDVNYAKSFLKIENCHLISYYRDCEKAMNMGIPVIEFNNDYKKEMWKVIGYKKSTKKNNLKNWGRVFDYKSIFK